MNHLLWKLFPKNHRELLLERLSVVDRQVVNKTLSRKPRFPKAFDHFECIFIHVSKCAGSSVATSIFGDYPTGHLPLYWYEKQFKERYEEYFKFAFVRDPLHRALSAYHYLLEKPQPRDRAAYELVSRYSNFDTFIDGGLHADNISRQIHFAPQHHFLQNSMGQIAVDFIGRQEHLEVDFNALCEVLEVNVPLKHLNRSSAACAGTASSCSTASRKRIREVYACDHELFAYD
ncbi:sulfotransferase family 2 domain-containing protein [Pseudomonas huanghezhanensis]|uniref:sulfotransferase family 2 domain-containing protein n=1 Tax=Pseudomonas huanghezhanensis TaxID=3002903 RepID=UPI002286C31C|nr:sulfotransferase family 2 domain-containing protein [Pseudomonas sp. BSw22131]